MIREWIEDHRAELVTMAIGLVVSVGITLALGGDIGEAFARRRRM